MKATTAKPVNAPITNARTRNTWSSRCCSRAATRESSVLRQLPLVVWASALISQADLPKAYRTGLRSEGGTRIQGAMRIRRTGDTRDFDPRHHVTTPWIVGKFEVGPKPTCGRCGGLSPSGTTIGHDTSILTASPFARIKGDSVSVASCSRGMISSTTRCCASRFALSRA